MQVGTPFITRFGAESFDAIPRHLSISRDAHGHIAIGSSDGVLLRRYGRFELVRMPNDTSGRVVLVGRDQKLYIGGFDQIGRIDESAEGDLSYVSLNKQFPLASNGEFIDEVWDGQANSEAVFFLTAKRILRLDYSGRGTIIPLLGESISMTKVDEKIYFRTRHKGLFQLVSDRIEPVLGGEIFSEKPLSAAFKRGEDVLFSAGKEGFYRLDETGLKPFPSQLDEIMKQITPYAVTTLHDGTFVMSTLEGEMLQFGSELKLLRRFKVSNFPIVAAVPDDQSGLWAATEGDVIRVELPASWTALTSEDGLHGSIEDSAWRNNTLWVGTTLGLYKGSFDARGRMRFTDTNWTQDEIWDLENLPAGLLFTRRNSIQIVRESSAEKLIDIRSPFAIQASSTQPNIQWVLAENEISALDLRGEKIREVIRVPAPKAIVSSMAELSKDQIIVGDFRGPPRLIQFDWAKNSVQSAVPILRSKNKIFDPNLATSVFSLDKRVYMAQADQLYRWETDGFDVYEADANLSQLKPFHDINFRNAKDGRVYAFNSRHLFVRRPNDPQWQRIQTSEPLARGVNEVITESDGSVTVLSWSALLRLDPSFKAPPRRNHRIGFARIELRNLKGETKALPILQVGVLKVLPHDSLYFRFGVQSIEENVEFRTKLAPNEVTYSPWRYSNESEFRQLAAGRYTLFVEAQAKSGIRIKPLQIEFVIEPRWYQIPAFKIFAILLLLAAVFALVLDLMRRRQLRFATQNIKLESMVEERTQDLAQANQRLARIADLDGLTGVSNRRRFDGYFQHQWDLCKNAREPLALLMIDVDHFKKFNDSRGHLSGDDELRAIARELQSAIQNERELVARYGGEEFALILPSVYLIEASRRAEALRTQIASRPSRYPMTISIGVVSAVPSDSIQPRDLIQAADAALYKAKHRGRNRIEIDEMENF